MIMDDQYIENNGAKNKQKANISTDTERNKHLKVKNYEKLKPDDTYNFEVGM